MNADRFRKTAEADVMDLNPDNVDSLLHQIIGFISSESEDRFSPLRAFIAEEVNRMLADQKSRKGRI